MEPEKTKDKTISFKSDRKPVELYTEAINYVKALADYVIIETDERRYITQSTMKEMEENLPSHFHRIHKSFIINEHKIVKKTRLQVTIRHAKKEISLNIGKTRRKELKKPYSSKRISTLCERRTPGCAFLLERLVLIKKPIKRVYKKTYTGT